MYNIQYKEIQLIESSIKNFVQISQKKIIDIGTHTNWF